MREARRLAINNPDETFVVYRADCAVEAPRVVVTEFEAEDIPF